MITNEEVLERIMRMGIEAKHDSSFPYLEKIAIRQLTEEKQSRKHYATDYPAEATQSLTGYINHCIGKGMLAFAFNRIGVSLSVVHLHKDPKRTIKWHGFVDSKIFPTISV